MNDCYDVSDSHCASPPSPCLLESSETRATTQSHFVALTCDRFPARAAFGAAQTRQMLARR